MSERGVIASETGGVSVTDETRWESNPVHVAPFAHISFARHAPRNVALADFFSNLLEEGP
jgi:hypothetical protein